MDKPVSISVNNLSRKFGKVWAIKNISFEIHKGEIVGFLGPNGAGKSTTMRILGGLQNGHTGFASVCGLSVAENIIGIKRKIGFMQENNPLPEELRVSEYLKLRAELKEIPASKLSEEVRRVMDLCDLFRTARRKIIRTLSKGFKQRVGIADALIGEPDIIILDEPTIGLDPHQIQGIRTLIDSLRGSHTVLISSHILSEIEKSCDRVIILNNGRLVAMGTKSELRESFIPENQLSITIKGDSNVLIHSFENAQLKLELADTIDFEDGIQELRFNRADNTQDMGPILKASNSLNNCQILGINFIKPDLESIFLAATKRSWEDVRTK